MRFCRLVLKLEMILLILFLFLPMLEDGEQPGCRARKSSFGAAQVEGLTQANLGCPKPPLQLGVVGTTAPHPHGVLQSL